MYARVHLRPAFHWLPVDVKRERLLRLDRRLAHAVDAAAAKAIDRAGEEPRKRADRREPRLLLDRHEIEQPVVDPRARRDARAVAELLRVGERDEERAHPNDLAAGADRVLERHVAAERAQGDADVAEEAAPVRLREG